MQKSPEHKYKKVAVFSGGGTRFAIYCGMFAALEDLGYKPDLVIGACGGAIATCIINSFPSNNDRKLYLKSEELFEFTNSTKLTGERKLHKIGLLCLKKILNRGYAPYIEDVFNRYLVDMPEDLATQLPSLANNFGTNIRSIIVGSEILFDKADAGKKRSGKKLYKKVLFTDIETADIINPNNINIQSENYLSGAIDPATEVITDAPMQTAARISISDMFYVQPVYYKGNYFAGGAIDLTPVELAKSMGSYIIFEKKNRYSLTEEALVRAVLGYSGNKRLKEIESYGADILMDTRKATADLAGHYCKKSIDLIKFEVSISLPQSYQQYTKDIDILWQYGYECVTKELES